MFFRMKDRFHRIRFNFLCRNILRTPPLQMEDANVTFVSQVSHQDLLMYLIAIKSIYRFFNAGKIVVLSDGSLTLNDCVTLTRHLPFVRITSAEEILPASTPKGGCWERLLLISDLVRNSYVIQVDSDSLTLDAVTEVFSFVVENCSFTLLGAGSFPAIESMSDACNRAQRNNQHSMEPQGVGERSLDRFPDSAHLRYVRGNAAFAGFARDSFTRKDVEFYSKNMELLCGHNKWHEWGSEQVTSNLIIANTANARILQHPRYTSYYALPNVDYKQSCFVHFMGTHRFENGCYANLSQWVIRHLKSEENYQSDSKSCKLLWEGSSSVGPAQAVSQQISTPERKHD